MSKYLTEVAIEITGDFDRKLAGMGRNFTRFGNLGNRALGGLSRTATMLAGSLNVLNAQLAGVFSFAAIGAGAKRLSEVQARMAKTGVSANMTAKEIKTLKEEIYRVGRMRNVSLPFDEIANGVDQILEKIGDKELAMSMVETIGLVTRATSATGQDVGDLVANMKEKFGLVGPEIENAFGTISEQGKQGAFTLAKFATQGNRVMAAMSATGRTGATAIREMSAVLQVFNTATASPEQTATAFERVLANLFDKADKLQGMGVKMFDPVELKKGRAVLLPLHEVLIDIMDKTKGRNQVKILNEIFGQEGVRGMQALMKPSSRAMLRELVNVTGDLSNIQADAAKNSTTLNGAMSRLFTTLEGFADSRFAGVMNQSATALQDFLDVANKDNGLKDEHVNRIVGAGLGLGARQGVKMAGSFMAGFKPVVEATEAAAPSGTTLAGMQGLAPAARATRGAMFASGMRGGLGFLSKAAPWITVGAGALDLAQAMGTEGAGRSGRIGRSIGGTLGGAGAGWAGAGVGAGIGSMILPGVGTAVGGVVGGLAGAFGGSEIFGRLGEAIGNLTQQTAKPKKDNLNVNIKVDSLAPVSVNAFGTGDSNLTSSVSLGRLAAR